MAEQPQDITRLLRDWTGNANPAALEQLTPIVYSELRKLALSYLRRERSDHTLQPTALIHEAYLRLVDQNVPAWRSRSHFFGVAAQLMRQILVDHARARSAGKRGGGEARLSLDAGLQYSEERSAELVALDDALTDLAKLDPRKAKVVELRYFGGLSVEETAEALHVSVATVGRELRFAEAWLHKLITGEERE
ncbi:MAG: sigma-70 family RNA polymerase sigma factor [Bryobacterales bacterium]|nr:sigma-70 family RNA polymerase sigma factor [Bryobacterales bacterium]